ncbi:MAG: hypothetical protein WAK17_06330, partial [Candidatus Nitrosopolaris sp.]
VRHLRRIMLTSTMNRTKDAYLDPIPTMYRSIWSNIEFVLSISRDTTNQRYRMSVLPSFDNVFLKVFSKPICIEIAYEYVIMEDNRFPFKNFSFFYPYLQRISIF